MKSFDDNWDVWNGEQDQVTSIFVVLLNGQYN